jgi:AcrR family transcriptional regulator
LDAVARVLRREGVEGVTTNKISAAAGVSIGSLYQYFPNKRAILVAVRDRHVDQMSRLIEDKLVQGAKAPLDELVHMLVEAMVDAHAAEPALYELLLTQLPQEPSGIQESLPHKAVLDRPPSLTLADATDEAARAVLGYIRAHS